METIANKSAFPFVTTEFGFEEGVTKREYFAALAMQGFCAAGYGEFMKTHEEHIAKLSVCQADALINALNKQP